MSNNKPINYLKTIRKESCLSQNDMATKIGVSLSYYSKVEGGFKEPSYRFLKKVKKEFGKRVNMNSFFV